MSITSNGQTKTVVMLNEDPPEIRKIVAKIVTIVKSKIGVDPYKFL